MFRRGTEAPKQRLAARNSSVGEHTERGKFALNPKRQNAPRAFIQCSLAMRVGGQFLNRSPAAFLHGVVVHRVEQSTGDFNIRENVAAASDADSNQSRVMILTRNKHRKNSELEKVILRSVETPEQPSMSGRHMLTLVWHEHERPSMIPP